MGGLRWRDQSLSGPPRWMGGIMCEKDCEVKILRGQACLLGRAIAFLSFLHDNLRLTASISPYKLTFSPHFLIFALAQRLQRHVLDNKSSYVLRWRDRPRYGITCDQFFVWVEFTN